MSNLENVKNDSRIEEIPRKISTESMVVNLKENPADLRNLIITPTVKIENSNLLKKEKEEVKPVPNKTTEPNLPSSNGTQNIKPFKSENEKPLNERPKSEENVKEAEKPLKDNNQAVNSTPTAVVNQAHTEVNKNISNSLKIDIPTSNENKFLSDTNISEKEKPDSKKIKSDKEINVNNLNIKENSKKFDENPKSNNSERQENSKTDERKPALIANKEFYEKLKVNEKIAVNILKETEKMINNTNENQDSIPKPAADKEVNKVIPSQNKSSTPKPAANQEVYKVIPSQNQSPSTIEKELASTTVSSTNKKENESFANEAKSYLNNFLDHPLDATKNITSFVIKPFNSIYHDLSKPNEKGI